MSRVVITGLGMTSCLGVTLADNWNLICGKLSGFSPSLSSSTYFGHLKEGISSDFAEAYMKHTHTLHSTLSFTTVIEVLNNANYFPNTPLEKNFIGLSEAFHIPDTHLSYLKSGSFTASNISAAINFTGPVTTSASGLQSIIEACQLIRNNEANLVVAYGASVEITESLLQDLYSQKLLKENPSDHKFLVAEGSAGVLVENLDHALKRGAKIYAEIDMHSNLPAEESVEVNLAGDLVLSSGNGIANFEKCEKKWLEGKRVVNYKKNLGWVVNADGINDTVLAALIIGQGVVPPVIGGSDGLRIEKLGKVSVLGFGMDEAAWVLELSRFVEGQ